MSWRRYRNPRNWWWQLRDRLTIDKYHGGYRYRFHRHPFGRANLIIIPTPRLWRACWGTWAVENGWWFEFGPIEVRRYTGIKPEAALLLADALCRAPRRRHPSHTETTASGIPGGRLPDLHNKDE